VTRRRRLAALATGVAIVLAAGCSSGRDRGAVSTTRVPTATTTTAVPVNTLKSDAGTSANPAAAYAPGWSTAHADAANTNYAPVKGASDLTPAWVHRFGGTVNLGATFAPSGRVYVTSGGAGCHLTVLDPVSGAVVWCSDAVDRFAVVSSALIDAQGRAFVADGSAMHAFDAEGHELWRTPIVGVPLSAQFTAEGRLIFVTNIGRVYVLRRETGALMLPPVALVPGARFDPAEGMRACARGTAACPSANTPAVDPATDRFFFTFWAPGATQAGVRAMRYTEDPVPAITPVWTNDSLPGGSASSPTLSRDGSRLYVNDNVDALHALDTASGKEIWQLRVGFAPGGSASVTPDGLVMPAGGGASPLLAVRDLGTRGKLAWRRDQLLNRGIPTQAAGGRAYAAVGTGQNHNALVVVDTATGAVLDREPLAGTTIFTVGTTIARNGWVYVPTITGVLFAFRPA
jgi:outer membrane protein assembly factor BamB